MKARMLGRIGLYVVLVAGVAVLGVVLGTAIGEFRAEAARSAKGESLQEYFERNLTGIEIGRPFPEVNVWSPDGTDAMPMSDVLPDSGLIVYVSTSCEECVKTIKMVNRYRRDSQNRDLPVVVITRGDPGTLLSLMADNGIDMPVYQDTEDAFASVYHVSALPSVFVLNGNRLVADMAGGPKAEDRVREFYTN